MAQFRHHIDKYAKPYLQRVIELHNLRLEELKDKFGGAADVEAVRIVAETRAIIAAMLAFHDFEVTEHPVTGVMTLRNE